MADWTQFAGSAEEPRDRRDQSGGIGRLRDVSVRARFDASLSIRVLDERGAQNYRHHPGPRVRAQAPGQREAVPAERM